MMKNRNDKIDYLMTGIICLMLLVVFPSKAYAYLDPGSGSYILQLILAGLLAASFTLKTFWKRVWIRIRALLANKKDTDEKPGSDTKPK